MQFFCSKCEKPVPTPDEAEAIDGYLYSCPECDGPIAFVAYEELEDAPETKCGACPISLTGDEVTYLVHIIDKQLQKLGNAAAQLNNIKEKLNA